MTHPLVKDNLTLLEQTRSLATDIDPQQYLAVGAHFRHLIQHYTLFLSHFAIGMVDYDLRDRDSLCENSREEFIVALSEVVAKLGELDVNPIASVKVNCATCTSWEASGALSTIGRELMFLHNHTTHHLALIALKLEMTGVTIDPSIGLAPSTQRYYNVAT